MLSIIIGTRFAVWTSGSTFWSELSMFDVIQIRRWRVHVGEVEGKIHSSCPFITPTSTSKMKLLYKYSWFSTRCKSAIAGRRHCKKSYIGDAPLNRLTILYSPNSLSFFPSFFFVSSFLFPFLFSFFLLLPPPPPLL